MKRKLWKLICPAALFLILLALSLALSAPAMAATTYESFTVTTGTTQNEGISGTSWQAQTFTTASAHTVSAVSLYFDRYTSNSYTPTHFTVSIRATDSSGRPTGGDLCWGTFATGSQYGSWGYTDWYTIPMTTIYPLRNNTKYAIVLRADSNWYWRDTFNTAYGGGYECGSFNSGLSWTLYTNSNDYPFQIQGDPSGVINEFVIDHTGDDTHQFVEFFGQSSTDYSNFSILDVDGNSSANPGNINKVYTVGTTDSSGFWTTGFLNQQLTTGTSNLLLVDGFTGTVGTDLDTNDDGVLESSPWKCVADSVAITKGGTGDQVYSLVVLNNIGGASRIPNGKDTETTGDWVINDFDGAGLPGFTGTPIYGEAYNTPGAANALVPQVINYTLTVATNPSNIDSTTGSGNYASGATASISAPEYVDITAGQSRYHFNGWTGPAGVTFDNAASLSTNVTMPAAATTVTANYVTQYKVHYAVTGNTLTITVPADEWVNSGSGAIGSFPARFTNTAGNIHDNFVSDNRPGVPPGITGPTTVTATYQTQHLVHYATTGAILTVTVPADEWANSGAAATGAFPLQVVNNAGNTRCSYVSDNRPAVPAGVIAPITVTATYQTQYLIHYSTISAVLAVTVPADEWANSGAAATGDFPLQVANNAGNTRCNYVSDNRPAVPAGVIAPITVTATYQTQYLVHYATTSAALTVAVPADEWANSGAAAIGAFPLQVVNNAGDTRCNYVSDNRPAVPTGVIAPVTVIATYQTQYYVVLDLRRGFDSAKTDGIGTFLKVNGSEFTGRDLPFSAWFSAGSSLNYEFTEVIDGAPGVKYGWVHNGGVKYLTDRASNIKVDAPTITQGMYLSYAVTVSPSSGQYSDNVSFKAQVGPYVTTALFVYPTDVHFYVGTQVIGSVALSPGADGMTKCGALSAPLLEKLTGQLAAGSKVVTAKWDNLDCPLNPTTSIIITKEDAAMTFTTPDTGRNPAAVKVASPGGSSGAFSFEVHITQANDGWPGDMALIKTGNVTTSLAPVGAGGSTITPTGNTISTDASGIRIITFNFNNVPVNTYDVTVTLNSNYFVADCIETVVTVYDPSLGFTTGGGWFFWPNTANAATGYLGDKTNFGYTMQYGKNGANLKGGLMVIHHMQNGDIYRIKSNALDAGSLTLGSTILPMGWASFSGKCNYTSILSEVPTTVGNIPFKAYVEDRNEPGSLADRFWIQVGGYPTLSLSAPASDNAISINGGNILAPHIAAKATK